MNDERIYDINIFKFGCNIAIVLFESLEKHALCLLIRQMRLA